MFSEANANILLVGGLYNHAIDLKGRQLLYGQIYNLSKKELKTLHEYLQDSLQHGWIWESMSLAEALILFTPKKDNKLRLYINYKGLNKVTQKNWYLILLINKILDRVVSAKIYIKLDLWNAY